MKLSEYMKALAGLYETHGDLEVHKLSANNLQRVVADRPRLAHCRVSEKPKFFNPAVEEEEKRGQAVIRV